MREVATRNRTRSVIVLLVLVVIALAWDAANLARVAALNREIAAGASSADADSPAELRFARAYAQAASQPANRPDEAVLNQYRALQGDTPVGQAARFNSANGLLRQAITVRAGPQPGQAIPLIELAKETYRELLRRQPEHWDARYNLERAQRLLPDPSEEEEMPPDGKREAERAATTMRGYSPGLP